MNKNSYESKGEIVQSNRRECILKNVFLCDQVFVACNQYYDVSPITIYPEIILSLFAAALYFRNIYVFKYLIICNEILERNMNREIAKIAKKE